MREKRKSGLFCCGQNLKKLRFYRGAMAVVSGLSLVGGLVLFSVVAQAAICFLPDCQDKPMQFEPSGADECLAAGYESTSTKICHPNSNIERCPENSSYIKCNLRQWCLDNGYTIVPDDCQVPQYADAQCPNGEVLYFQCKEDLEKACLEEDNDYVSDCQDGWTLDDTELCSYSDLYGKCCNLCADYPYEADEIPQGYQTGGSCLACGNVTRYQKELNDCAAQGFIQCDKGGQTGTEVCWRGDEKWYKECCAPCDDYPYLESQIPEGYVKGDSCDSCDGMKYKVKEGECGSGYVWENDTCVKVSCDVGYVLNSDMTCTKTKEDGKTPIGVISYASGSTRLAINLVSTSTEWGGYRTDISGLTNYSSSPHTTDFSGKSNTSIIVSALGDTSSYAAGYCYNFTTAGTSKGDWYLPAHGELYAPIYTNYSAVNNGIKAAGGTAIKDGYHWSSSEYSSNGAWSVVASGGVPWNYKNGYESVRCALAFEDNGNGTGTLCGNDYLYTCTVGDDTHITGGVGTACGGLYQSCQCASGYVWYDGACVACDETCSVGNILYSDYTCSSCNVSGKTPIGVISYASGSTRLAINLVSTQLAWGGSGTDISGLTNITSSSTAKNDFSGKSNTSIIVSALGYTSSYAAGYCYNFTTAGTSKGQWYLPAAGELYASIYTNYSAVNSGLSAAGGTSVSGYHWSSSEASSRYAWGVGANDGYANDYFKYSNRYYVRCVLGFEDNGEGTGTLCGNDYLYTCTVGDDTHITGGVGVSCGGLYQSCQCAAGYEWKDGACEKSCDNTCSVGNILYSDHTCSSCKVSGKTPIGVISYMNGSTRLAINLVNTSRQWGGYGTDISGLTNITSFSTAKNDFSGKSNTSKIVSVLGSSSTSYAAGYCYNYTTTGTSKGQWYLPAEGELYATVSTNKAAVNSGLSAAGGTAILNDVYWSSSESSKNDAWVVYAGGGNVYDYVKVSNESVRCVLGFEVK